MTDTDQPTKQPTEQLTNRGDIYGCYTSNITDNKQQIEPREGIRWNSSITQRKQGKQTSQASILRIGATSTCNFVSQSVSPSIHPSICELESIYLSIHLTHFLFMLLFILLMYLN